MAIGMSGAIAWCTGYTLALPWCSTYTVSVKDTERYPIFDWPARDDISQRIA
ncbi:hypothetical protein HYPSUDRAFT_33399 [Hypholoma sublateritium FD-334 SS-4]|uniref:Uncharacterized protein n=1 Tax=Hypholoma sublateritium (strain FD-334 SS-4) TaxID=945553 RepID=A0A0D2PKL6_HYPSF|nr:hypothetical protein HYPSUDRAFT_33399 [Hypholoma sublateritium FD-334 SS-4]